MQPTNSSNSTMKWILVITGSICILTVLVVIVLIAVALPMMRHFREAVRQEAAATNLRNVEAALRNYEMSATEMPTIDTVREIVSLHLGVDVKRIKPSTSLADLQADDLDLVELIMELEEHFSISILDESTPGLDEKLSLKNPHGLPPMGELTMLKLAEIVDLRRKSENK